MYYGKIKEFDSANGEGIRTTLFVSGCTNCCKGCFQPQTWDFHYGREYNQETQEYILAQLDFPLMDGLVILGGEPMEAENQRCLVGLCREVKRRHPNQSIWCYTGCIYEKDLQSGQRRHIEVTDELLSYIDVLIDGPFCEERKNISLSYRGSENQRIIDLAKTRENGELTLYKKGILQ